MKVVLIDYEAGNIASVFNAVSAVKKSNHEIIISKNKADLKTADSIILPGVGSFGTCINNLKESGIFAELEEQVINQKKPFFGICVGMQILASIGYEDGINQGFNWLNGEIRKINDTNLKIKTPQMGWNNVCIKENKHPLLANINNEEHFYFANSYHFIGEENAVLGYCEYGVKIASIIAKNNIFATQFHPEKSGIAGLKIIENFLNWDFSQNKLTHSYLK